MGTAHASPCDLSPMDPLRMPGCAASDPPARMQGALPPVSAPSVAVGPGWGDGMGLAAPSSSGRSGPRRQPSVGTPGMRPTPTTPSVAAPPVSETAPAPEAPKVPWTAVQGPTAAPVPRAAATDEVLDAPAKVRRSPATTLDQGGKAVGGKVTVVTGALPGMALQPTRSVSRRPECDTDAARGTELCTLPGADQMPDDCFNYGLRTFGGRITSPEALADEFCGASFRRARDVQLSVSRASSESTQGVAAKGAATKDAGAPSISPELVRQSMEAFLAFSPAQRLAVMRVPALGEFAIARMLVGDAERGVDDPQAFLSWLNDSFNFRDAAVAAFCAAVMAQSRGFASAGAPLPGNQGGVNDYAEVVIDGMPHGGRAFWNWMEVTSSGRGWLDAGYRRWAVQARTMAGQPRQLVVMDAAGRARGVMLDLRGPTVVAWDRMTAVPAFNPQVSERPNKVAQARPVDVAPGYARPIKPSGAPSASGADTMRLISALPLDEVVRVMQGPAFRTDPYVARLAAALLAGTFDLDGFPIVDLFIANAKNTVVRGSVQQAILDADVLTRARAVGLVLAPSGSVAPRFAPSGIPAGFTGATWAQLLATNPAVAAQIQASDDRRAEAEAARPTTAQTIQNTVTGVANTAVTAINNQNTAALQRQQADYQNQQAMARIRLEADQAAAQRALAVAQSENATNPNAVAIANAQAAMAASNAAMAASNAEAARLAQAATQTSVQPVVEASWWSKQSGIVRAAVVGVPTLALAGGAFMVLRPSRGAKRNGRGAAKRHAKKNCGEAAGRSA
jgi:hypothetical protein